MNMKTILRLSAPTLVCLAFAACASADTNSAPKAIENYITALVDKDRDAAVNAACADWEDDATLESDSFAAVAPVLNGLACTASGTDGDATLVTCEGAIDVTYNNEVTQLPLDNRTYLAVEEAGEWRMCGYK
jgi:hypothetical protein